MGALHAGHISLIAAAKADCDLVVCSIFVNPTQFNDPEDLKKYPRTLEADSQMLEEAGCDVLFAPEVSEMYSAEELEKKRVGQEDDSWKAGKKVDFGALDKVMEGSQRPGHFNGVAQVVSKLFRIVRPDKAYFGKKDFQQLAIIRSMVDQLQLPVSIIGCPILREPDGLAMSSRNTRLNSEERALAPRIYQSLEIARSLFPHTGLSEIKQQVLAHLAADPHFKVDYVEIADSETLQPLTTVENGRHPVVFIAVFLGPVRLIDNLVL